MTSPVQPPISLDTAKQLVVLLETGENQAAAELLENIAVINSANIFAEVGKLTRQLHDTLNNFQLDPRISNLATDAIPDAQSRLTYVIETTEAAANSTMDTIEQCTRINQQMQKGLNEAVQEWKKSISMASGSDDITGLATQFDSLLEDYSAATLKMNTLLTDVLVAQGFQDITGQIIRRVIEIVKEVENSLVQMLTMFGSRNTNEKAKKDDIAKHSAKETDKQKAEGPIIDADNREDTVSGQDDVDDLLSSLGF